MYLLKVELRPFTIIVLIQLRYASILRGLSFFRGELRQLDLTQKAASFYDEAASSLFTLEYFSRIHNSFRIQGVLN